MKSCLALQALAKEVSGTAPFFSPKRTRHPSIADYCRDSTGATLADKIHALDDYLEEWSKSSAAMRDALPDLGLRLASKHAAELASSSTDAWGVWRGLERYFHADRAFLIEHVVAALRNTAHSLGGNAWLALAAKLASDVSASAIAEGLERFLANTGEKLPSEVGDGPWDARFAVPVDEATFVAGLVWARLGHPSAAMRWRAAHAVRRLVHAGCPDVVERLIERFGSASSLPFGDVKLPFYIMHAQLWLLIALARVSERSLVVALMLQKYHRGKSSGHLGGTGAFTHRSLVVVINERGQIWSPRSLSRQAKKALATLTPYRRRDFYPRFRAIAGLTDEWHCRRDNLPDLDDIDLVFINSPNGS